MARRNTAIVKAERMFESEGVRTVSDQGKENVWQKSTVIQTCRSLVFVCRIMDPLSLGLLLYRISPSGELNRT